MLGLFPFVFLLFCYVNKATPLVLPKLLGLNFILTFSKIKKLHVPYSFLVALSLFYQNN
jgi:hypothetical protein